MSKDIWPDCPWALSPIRSTCSFKAGAKAISLLYHTHTFPHKHAHPQAHAALYAVFKFHQIGLCEQSPMPVSGEHAATALLEQQKMMTAPCIVFFFFFPSAQLHAPCVDIPVRIQGGRPLL